MARINDFKNLSKLLNVLINSESGYISYTQLARKMGCSKKEAEKTVLSICQSEVGGGELGISIVESPEDLAELLEIAWLSGDKSAANCIPKSIDEPGIFANLNSKLLGSKPRLSFEESWALLLCLAFAGIDSQTELAKKLESAACQFDFDSHTQAVDAVCEIENYSVLAALALLCAQHRLALIEYEQAKSAEGKGCDNLDYVDDDAVDTGDDTDTTNKSCQTTKTRDANEPSLRKILPLEIYTDTNGQTYLFAYQYEKNIKNPSAKDSGARVYKISRIADIEPLPQHEKDPQILGQRRTINKKLFRDSTTARLQITSKCCFDKRTWVDAEIVDMSANNFVIEMPLHANTTWISRSIAARLGEAKVIKPASLSKDVSASAANILKEIEQLEAEIASIECG